MKTLLALVAASASVSLLLAAPAHADEPIINVLAAPVAPVDVAPQPLRAPWTNLHVVGGDVVVERVSETGAWVRHCAAPCDVDAPLDSLYRVTAVGMIPSRPFQLRGESGGRTVLEVHPTPETSKDTRKGLIITGAVLLGVGTVSLLAYAVSAAASSAVSSCTNTSVPDGPCTNGTPPQTLPKGFLDIGLGALVVGGIGLVAGLATGRPTSVDQGEHDEATARRTAVERWARLPTWQEEAPMALPHMTGVPLLSGTF